MQIDQFDFDLPKDLIANSPVEPRDYARLLVYNRALEQVEYGHFFDLPNYLGAGDVLIFNNSRVIPSRLVFEMKGKEVEVFFLEFDDGIWKAFVKPGKRFRVGVVVQVDRARLEVVGIDKDGFRLIRSNLNHDEMLELFEGHGSMPVPPYIEGNKFQKSDYNTVFSTKCGSVAAPTAGLHFTDQLLARLREKGVRIEFITLHVGLGTFLPIKVKDSRFHKMHEETYEIDYQTAKRLNSYKREGRRIVAVGTTAVRALESNITKFGEIKSGLFSTKIFIEPGYTWLFVNALITNFHLPKSTLLMLVSAMLGQRTALSLYQMAIARKFRFYSFGDGMMIV